MRFYACIFFLFVACTSGHNKELYIPVLIHEDEFLITDPFAAYELDSQLLIDLPNQGKFVLLDAQSGKMLSEQSYAEIFNPNELAHLSSLIAELQKADAQFVRFKSITPGWFTSHHGDIVFVGYAQYIRRTETAFDEEEGTANILLLLNQKLVAKSGSLLFPVSVQMVAPPPAIAYYPNAYFNGDIIDNSLYIPNYYLDNNQPLQNLPAFTVWNLADLTNIKTLKPLGKTINFLTEKQLSERENGYVFLANVTSFKQGKQTLLLAISQDGLGEDLRNGMPLAIHPNSVLIQSIRHNNRPDRLLFLDYQPNEKSFRRYFTASNLMKTDSLAIEPPEGYVIKKVAQKRNNHLSGSKFILSKNDSLFIWHYTY